MRSRCRHFNDHSFGRTQVDVIEGDYRSPRELFRRLHVERRRDDDTGGHDDVWGGRDEVDGRLERAEVNGDEEAVVTVGVADEAEDALVNADRRELAEPEGRLRA